MIWLLVFCPFFPFYSHIRYSETRCTYVRTPDIKNKISENVLLLPIRAQRCVTEHQQPIRLKISFLPSEHRRFDLCILQFTIVHNSHSQNTTIVAPQDEACRRPCWPLSCWRRHGVRPGATQDDSTTETVFG